MSSITSLATARAQVARTFREQSARRIRLSTCGTVFIVTQDRYGHLFPEADNALAERLENHALSSGNLVAANIVRLDAVLH